MHRLVLIEGIPGSGKTTMSKKLYQALTDQGLNVEQYTEGDQHPADLSWQSILSIDEYNFLLSKYPEHESDIKGNSIMEDDIVITAYTLLNINHESDLYKYLENHEIYSINADLETFKQAHLTRWKKFVEQSDNNTIYIFECVLLQNHITQLMLEYEASQETINIYIKEFLEVIKEMSPIIHYLSPLSVEEAITHVAKERRPENQERQNIWIDRVLDYVVDTPYGIRHKITGIEGFIKFSSHRQSIEKKLLDQLEIEANIIEHDGLSWNRVLENILNHSLS